jgi:sec-independent protein translocase protein TatC
MADEPGAERLDTHEEEEEGGPVKSFLEHLEDLRWVLIKSLVALGIAMLGCLLAANYVVKVLEWPLRRAPIQNPRNTQTVRLFFGTNQIAVYYAPTNDPLSVLAGTNPSVRLELAIDTNNFLRVIARPVIKGSPEEARERLPIDIISLGPAAPFFVVTKLAFYAGMVLAAPFILYFVAHFVFPALRMREKKYTYRGLFFGVGLFLIGICFCYFVLMPIALVASAQFAGWLGFASNQWRAEEYIGFVCKFMLGMGLGFELPVVVLTLVKIGVFNYRILAGARRYVIVISFFLGAVLTTPEVVTQVLMAIPLLILYEICVWITWYWERQEKKRQAEMEAAT